MAQTSHAVWNLACNLALDAEELDQRASGRTPEEMRASAKSFASHVVGLLATSSAPYTAMTDFVYWIRRRAYRSARRDTQTGARVPWRNPGAYWTSVATGLACEAERSQWACATKDAEEELISRLNAEAAAWERRTQEERQRQAEHEAERARWAQRATDYLAAEEYREEARLTGDGNPDQDPDDGFGGWQRRRERSEQECRLSDAPNIAHWAEQLSEDEALGFLHRAMSDSVDDPQAPSHNQQPSRQRRPNPPRPQRRQRHPSQEDEQDKQDVEAGCDEPEQRQNDHEAEIPLALHEGGVPGCCIRRAGTGLPVRLLGTPDRH